MTASQKMMLTRFTQEEIDLFYRILDFYNGMIGLELQELRTKNSGKNRCEKDN